MEQDLRQLHQQFLEYSQFTRNLSPDTLRGYRGSFALLMRRYPDLALERIDVATMEEFFKWLQTRSRTVGRDVLKCGVMKSTVATYWRKLSKFFDWLKARRILRSNPLRSNKMEFPTVRYEDKRYLDRQKVETILAAISFNIVWKNNFVRRRNLAIISVALNCGLRKGELLGLKLTDLDLVRNQLTVRGETSKSQHQRTVPLNSRAVQDIGDYLNERQKRSYMTPFLWASDGRDGALSSNGLKNLVALLSDRSGVKFHLHQLRHTFAVNFLANTGQNSLKLQHLLGHRNIVSTAVYTRCLPPEIARDDIERLARLDNTL